MDVRVAFLIEFDRLVKYFLVIFVPRSPGLPRVPLLLFGVLPRHLTLSRGLEIPGRTHQCNKIFIDTISQSSSLTILSREEFDEELVIFSRIFNAAFSLEYFNEWRHTERE
jgi:hypothetical protein